MMHILYLLPLLFNAGDIRRRVRDIHPATLLTLINDVLTFPPVFDSNRAEIE